jgi:integrase
VGLDAQSLAGHSLRSGLATTAARNGASEASIMRQTGHKSVTMLRRYIREGSLFHDNASGKIGL